MFFYLNFFRFLYGFISFFEINLYLAFYFIKFTYTQYFSA
jgi:hypothetical protein